MTATNRYQHMVRLSSSVVALIVCLTTFSGFAATLADYGHGSMKRGEVAALGAHPLLVIVANIAGPNPVTNSLAYYENRVFNIGNEDTVNGYFWENSNHRFFWDRAAGSGVVGPIAIPANERLADWRAALDAEGNTNVRDHAYAWFSNIIARTMIDTSFDFSLFDSNDNKVVESGELGILIFSNETQGSGSHRWTRRVKAGNSTVAVDMGASQAGHLAHMNLIVHETSHILGTWDIYGSTGLSRDLSMLGSTSAGGLYHIDPWHKMALGWIDPVIRSLNTGGSMSIRSVNHLQTDQTIIFEDPAGGISKFFMAEYRSQTSPVGTNTRFDRDVAGTGMVLWSVELNAGKRPYMRTNDFGNEYFTVYSSGASDLWRGGNKVWTSDSSTPNLRWDDGTELTQWIRVHPFANGDPTIQVEWWNRTDHWAAFNFTGTPVGTFSSPFRSLSFALPRIPRNAILNIKSSDTPEQLRITKKVKLKPWNGPVTIGR